MEEIMIEIYSVQQYITEIDNLGDKKFLFRGESDYHEEITASVLRSHKGQYYDSEKLRKDYYREIAHELSQSEKDNFLAYSQHHGLPTPLIDITTNPLVALYFSTAYNLPIKTGYVHVFDRNNCIPFDILPKNYIDRPFGLSTIDKYEGFLKFLEENRPETYDLVVYLLTDLLKKIYTIETGQTFSEKIILNIRNHLKSTYKLEEIYKSNLESIICDLEKEEVIFSELNKSVRYYDNKSDSFYFYTNTTHNSFGREFTYGFWWIFLINRYDNCFFTLDTHVTFHKRKDYSMIPKPVIPPVLYQSEISFDRMKVQNGLFFYQLFSKFGRKRPIITQHIMKDHTFKINDKLSILKQLDRIGINRKTLFLDHDNTAKYLAEKQF